MVSITGSFGERSVEITGGRAEIDGIDETIREVQSIDEGYGTTSQLFNASRIAGRNHLLHSSKLALEALENGVAFADSPAIELTCWAAGSRQINKSLEKVGVEEGSNRKVAVVTIGQEPEKVEEAQERIVQNLGVEVDEKVLEISEGKVEGLKEAFSINEEQLSVSSPDKLVLEQVALLSLER